MSNASWKDHFTQPISGYDPVEAQGLSELGYALRNSQIPEEQYLRWARETFELASLDMKFFQTIPAPREVYEKVKDVYAWGPELVPIGEWEEHLLIAGLQKPDDFPAELNPIFLLAPVSGLVEFWTKFNSESSENAEESSEPIESSGMPEGFSFDPTAAPQTNVTSLSFSGIKLATAHDTPAPAEANKPAAPVAETKAEPTALSIGEETGLKITQTLSEIKPIPAAKAAIPQQAPPLTTSSYITVPLTPKTPPPLPNAKPAEAIAEKTVYVEDSPASVLENTVPEIKAQPQIIEEAGQAKIEEPRIREVFAECKKHYEKQIYIEFNDAKKTAVARYWPLDFVANETPSEHSLVEDCFLAIVAKTQKPYHGYVVKNAMSDRFFKEVNSGVLPENITVVPLVKNDVVIGALMGWGSKSTYTLAVLRDLERSVNNLCVKIGWINQDAA